jgi:hypothetical protein
MGPDYQSVMMIPTSSQMEATITHGYFQDLKRENVKNFLMTSFDTMRDKAMQDHNGESSSLWAHNHANKCVCDKLFA